MGVLYSGFLTSAVTHHGFTGHEHLDEVGLIHMNGRVYDPQLGRFLSADPFVHDPLDPQALNRYTYAGNNPLSYTDPSGFFLKKLFRGIKRLFRGLARFIRKYSRVIVAAVAGFLAYGAVSSWVQGSIIANGAAGTLSSAGALIARAHYWGTVAGSAAAGFVAGGIVTGDLKGAFLGAVSGGMFGSIAASYGNT